MNQGQRSNNMQSLHQRPVKFILIAGVLLYLGIQLYAARYLDGQLQLDVMLSQGREIKLHSRDKIVVAEANSAILKVLPGDISISLVEGDQRNYYGITSRSEILPDSVDGEYELWQNHEFEDQHKPLILEKLIWQNAALQTRKEAVWFEDRYFPDYDAAKDYALGHTIPLSRIFPIEMQGSRVLVTSGKHKHYFEAPLSISCSGDVFANDQKYGYSGTFKLKVVGDKLTYIHQVFLEEYIAGVIQNEIGNGAPDEALKAQAVAARTHAISLLLYNRHGGSGYDLCNDVHCQVYRGRHLLNDRVLNAVQETHGYILTFENKVIDATYHSSSGGKTDSSQNIWKGLPVPYLMGVDCDPEAGEFDLTTETGARKWIDRKAKTTGMTGWEKSTLTWSQSISKSKLMSNLKLSSLRTIEIISRGKSGRILKMCFNGETILDGEYRIRQAFGGLPSSFFYIHGHYSVNSQGSVVFNVSETIKLSGKGSGHGVGMCQVTALAKARNNETWQDIITFFYPGTNLKHNWQASQSVTTGEDLESIFTSDPQEPSSLPNRVNE